MLATRTVAEWLRAAQDASPDAFALYRIIRDEAGAFQDLEFLYTSPATARMAGGAGAEELVGKRLLTLFPAYHGTALWEGSRRVADTGEPLRHEMPYQDGPIAGWLETTVLRLDEQCLAITKKDITDRKRTQDRLLVAERTLAAIIAVAADAIIGYDAAQGITIFNESAERVFGYAAAEVLGQHFEVLLPERFRPRHRQHVQNFAASADVTRKMGEHQAVFGRRKNGEEFAAEASISKVQVGGLMTFTVALRDVSDRIGAEELRVRHASLVASSADAIICSTPEGIILDWNPAAERMLGYSAAEIIGTPLFNLLEPAIPSEPHDAVIADYLQVCQGGRVAPYETVRRRKDGSSFDALVSRFAIRDGSGAVLGVATTLQDITQRKRLERHQALLATVSATLAQSIDYDQTLATVARLCIPTFADQAMLYFFDGATPRHLAVHVDPRKQADLQAIIEHLEYKSPGNNPAEVALRLGKPVLHTTFSTQQHLAHLADSALFPSMLKFAVCSVLCVPVALHGKTLGVLGLAYSDSGRQYCAADVPLAEEIAHRAALAMETARLYREAQAAVQARDELLAFVSHDLANLLSPIQLLVSALRKQPTPTDGRSSKYLEVIDQASARMKFLVADLLNLANLQAGKLTIHAAAVDAPTLLGELLAAVEPLAAKKQIRFEQRIAADVGKIVCDPQRIFQVLFNLCSNAIQYVALHGRVQVQLDRIAGGVQFAVRDNGSGIPASRLPELFQRFSKGEGGHNGLGLYIAKSLVEAHGGKIWVESREGQGCTFFLTLPQEPHRPPPEQGF